MFIVYPSLSVIEISTYIQHIEAQQQLPFLFCSATAGASMRFCHQKHSYHLRWLTYEGLGGREKKIFQSRFVPKGHFKWLERFYVHHICPFAGQ